MSIDLALPTEMNSNLVKDHAKQNKYFLIVLLRSTAFELSQKS
jgi:hypothetical protein